MQKLLKLDTIIVPPGRIRSLNLAASIGTGPTAETGIELGVFGLDSTFTFTGQAAQRAYPLLKDVVPATAAPTLSAVVTINGIITPVLEVTTVDGTTIPVSFVIGPDVFQISEIEWIDLATDFGVPTGVGIEMRIASDAIGITRQFAGEQAEAAYATLVALVANQDAVTVA